MFFLGFLEFSEQFVLKDLYISPVYFYIIKLSWFQQIFETITSLGTNLSDLGECIGLILGVLSLLIINQFPTFQSENITKHTKSIKNR